MGELEVYAAVINEDGEVFLVAGPEGSHLPGGAFPPSEAIEAAAMRLVKEQAGLDVSVDVLTGLYQRPQDGRLALVVYRQIEMDTFSTEIPHFQRVKVPTFSI